MKVPPAAGALPYDFKSSSQLFRHLYNLLWLALSLNLSSLVQIEISFLLIAFLFLHETNKNKFAKEGYGRVYGPTHGCVKNKANAWLYEEADKNR